MNPENGVSTEQGNSFSDVFTAFQELETQRDELVLKEQLLAQQIINDQSEKDKLASQIVNLDLRLNGVVEKFISQSVSNLPPLPNAVFTIGILENKERFANLNPTEKLLDLSIMNFQYQKLAQLESRFANIDKPLPILALDFGTVELVDNAIGRGSHSYLTGTYITLGEIKPGTKFEIPTSSISVERGLSTYTLPHSVRLPISNVLNVDTRTFSWDEDIVLDDPRSERKDVDSIMFVGPSKQVEVVEDLNELSAKKLPTQLILGFEAVSAVLSIVEEMPEVDTRPLPYAARYLIELGARL